LDVWKHLKFGAPAPGRYLYWMMAEKMGWTMDYIMKLPLGVFHEWLQIMDARAKAATK